MGALGIGGTPGKWKSLWAKTFGYRSDAPCTHQPLASRLEDWWSEFGPHWPAWNLFVYYWHPERPGEPEEYEELFAVLDISYTTLKRLERELPLAYSPYPITVVRDYRWA